MLLNAAYPPKFRKYMESIVRSRNIDVVFNEIVDDFPSEGTVGLRTRAHREFTEADLVVSNLVSIKSLVISTVGNTDLCCGHEAKYCLHLHPGL